MNIPICTIKVPICLVILQTRKNFPLSFGKKWNIKYSVNNSIVKPAVPWGCEVGRWLEFQIAVKNKVVISELGKSSIYFTISCIYIYIYI
jgi:hypothetical protein